VTLCPGDRRENDEQRNDETARERLAECVWQVEPLVFETRMAARPPRGLRRCTAAPFERSIVSTSICGGNDAPEVVACSPAQTIPCAICKGRRHLVAAARSALHSGTCRKSGIVPSHEEEIAAKPTLCRGTAIALDRVTVQMRPNDAVTVRRTGGPSTSSCRRVSANRRSR
jgi:hypothetical protein